jgi:hypothetical protein
MTVEPKVIIVDAVDVQSPKFDGALIDHTLWPRVFTVDGTPVALVESVLAAIEVKSSLDKSELEDIFKKSKLLRSMNCHVSNSAVRYPLVTAFAYGCSNLNLSFFDFATLFMGASEYSPSLVCILNQGLFGLANVAPGKATPVDEPCPSALPVLYRTQKDTLLVYLYFLSRWGGMEASAAQVFRRYSGSLFSSMKCFYFDMDFLRMIASSETIRNATRKRFLRRASSNIQNLYIEARRALGLPANLTQ